MSKRTYGTQHFNVECERCGQDVTFSISWDYGVGVGVTPRDTEHLNPRGELCDLPAAQVDQAIETPDVPERDYREDR